MVYTLTDELIFPPAHLATHDGLLAIGGDLSVERLILAYHSGIFPWFEEESPLLWWSPDPRMVLYPEQLKISKSMKKLIRNKAFKVTINKSFTEVISNCAQVKRKDQEDTWITTNMINAYCELHELGWAHSVEVWDVNEKLIGGLYGILLKDKGVFCGESMFTHVSNASKYGFISFVQYLHQEYNIKLIDCQVYTKHLDSLGAKTIPRAKFLSFL
ncbi:leucyl/phenylalanyl-tRNA--protein transferase [Mesonia hippocampi]|uniref:Leucyl/phenylalanyl-tRNA--protein transferase n=1 Tax=Mesonia hippocampi TaxID=1628250 RepID=A0A840ELZ7_9FLAO|nr:leucyl/phenylalanyl-tRNA--protein transferase [Mesonia hippocampi]MBB4119399.1 leucyl/phenylalanyl-tRNA--protein transferase [Mesonia hippocampi]